MRLYLFDDRSVLGVYDPKEPIDAADPDDSFDDGIRPRRGRRQLVSPWMQDDPGVGDAFYSPKDRLVAYHLSPSGASLVVELLSDDRDASGPPRQGRLMRMLTSHCPAKHWRMVEMLLAFRNTYELNPFVPLRLVESCPGGMEKTIKAFCMWSKTSTPIEFGRWPLPPLSDLSSHPPNGPPPALSDHLSTHSDGSRILHSIDRALRLTLQPHHQSFTVHYPVAVADDNTRATSRTNAKSLTYIWIEQRFATRDPPPCWRYPLDLARGRSAPDDLLALARRAGHVVASRYVAVALPQSNVGTAPSDPGNAAFAPCRDTLLDPFRPRRVKALRTHLGLFRVLPVVAEARGVSMRRDFDVEVTLAADSAVARASDGFSFLNLYTLESARERREGCVEVTGNRGRTAEDGDEDVDGWEPEMYPIENAPEVATNHYSGRRLVLPSILCAGANGVTYRYPLKSILEEMMKLYHNAHHTLVEEIAGGGTSQHPLTETGDDALQPDAARDVPIPNDAIRARVNRLLLNIPDHFVADSTTSAAYVHPAANIKDRVVVPGVGEFYLLCPPPAAMALSAEDPSAEWTLVARFEDGVRLEIPEVRSR
ncbi:hypothetical protein HK101_005949, partial [Irineochytrium annulatum]